MKNQIFNKNSKTHWATVATGAAGSLLTFAPQVMAFVPVDYYGPIFIGLGVTFHVLRNVTATSIDQK